MGVDAGGTGGARLPHPATGVFVLALLLSGIAASSDAPTTLRVGGDAGYAPYHFIDERGEADGFDIALVRAVADDLELAPVFELGDWEQVLHRLGRGELDVVPMFWSAEREKRYLMTDPILLRHHALFGHFETPTVESLDALLPARVAVQQAGLAWEALRELDRPGIVLVEIDNEGDTLALVARGEADYALAPTGTPVHISINVSANDLADPRIVDAIIRAADGDLPELMLEVTETEVMREPERVAQALPRLREHGVRISLDDFGAGHSSLVNLRRLGPDELKIDRSFVQALLTSGSDRAIVRATIELGHELGATVAAEGIEDQATRDWLAEAGCDIGQGFWIARPMPPGEFATLLRREAIRGPAS